MNVDGASSLIDSLKRQGIVRSRRVEEAMLRVPRELFVWPGTEHRAYEDVPLPLGDTGQTISAPHMVAIMLEALEVEPGNHVLEIGTGSGYNAALLAELVGRDGNVVSVERLPELVEFARSNLKRAGYLDRVEVVLGDGSLGYPPRYEGPLYDRVTITASAPRLPRYPMAQLRDGGILLVPLGPPGYQVLTRVRRRGNSYSSEELLGCVFVPLVGEDGYGPGGLDIIRGSSER
jgi:protein-L-isoaspartate(D-aspartate) O-methyltransferase